MSTYLHTKRGARGFVVTVAPGVVAYRRDIEQPDDPFVLVECDLGHVYAVSRDAARTGAIPDCPRCADENRRAA